MKTLVFVFLFICSLYMLSCADNTSTKDPSGGYKERSSDSATAITDSVSVPKDNGAVALDTIKNGQASMSGAKSSDTSK